jgi:hypothetical protein
MAYTTIDDPSAYFQTKIYTGNGSSGHAITFDGNSDLQPDWIWNKSRSIADSHAVFDSTRGINKILFPNITNAESTDTNGNLESFDTNGITVGGNQEYANKSGSSQVTWAWKANGGTTSSNTDGSITSTVQVDTTAGFSIVTYDGNGSSGATFGHGLGTVPNFIIIKNRSEVKDWTVYHGANTSAPETDALFLNLTDATIDNAGYWNDTAPTSSIITVGDNTKVNSSGEQHVAYCFAEKQGYSKFGSYTGNGNADGPMVYCGFKPAWLMYKTTGGINNWNLLDNKRSPTNVVDKNFYPDSSNAEMTSTKADFLSNGFKIRTSDNQSNTSGTAYIYMAFASSPFVGSDGVPTTAR